MLQLVICFLFPHLASQTLRRSSCSSSSSWLRSPRPSRVLLPSAFYGKWWFCAYSTRLHYNSVWTLADGNQVGNSNNTRGIAFLWYCFRLFLMIIYSAFVIDIIVISVLMNILLVLSAFRPFQIEKITMIIITNLLIQQK